MSFTLRRVFPLPTFLILATGAFLAQFTRAQVPENATAAVQPNSSPTEPARPARRTDQTATNDPIALIAVHQQALRPAGHSADPGNIRIISAKETSPATTQAQNIPETVAGIERQIAEKQKRIALLMRLFVDDGRPFLNDPTNTNVDPNIHDRRKYEQDELLYESSEIARLGAKAQELRLAGQNTQQGEKKESEKSFRKDFHSDLRSEGDAVTQTTICAMR